MHEWFLSLAFFLLLNVVAGLLRILRGPTPADAMLAAQLFGTTGVAVVLLLAPALGPALNDVALVLVLLAATATVAFVRRAWQRGQASDEGSRHR